MKLNRMRNIVGVALVTLALALFVGQMVRAAQPGMCWCCYKTFSGSHVIHTTQADCTNKHGQCYATKGEAVRACNAPPAKCYCCKNGQVTHIAQMQCQEIQGQCYATYKDAMLHCPSKTGDGQQHHD